MSNWSPCRAGPLYFDRAPREAKRLLSRPAYAQLNAILEFRKGNSRYVECSDEVLASALLRCPGTIRRHFPELERGGWVKRLPATGSGGRYIEVLFDLRTARGDAPPPPNESGEPDSEARAGARASERDGARYCRDSRSEARAPSFSPRAPERQSAVSCPSPSDAPAPACEEPIDDDTARRGASLAMGGAEDSREQAQALGPAATDAPEVDRSRLIAEARDMVLTAPRPLRGLWAKQLAALEAGTPLAELPMPPPEALPPEPPPRVPYAPGGTGKPPPRARTPPDDKAAPMDEIRALARRLDDPGPTLAEVERLVDALADLLCKRWGDGQSKTRRHYRRAAMMLSADRLVDLVQDADTKDEPAKWFSTATKTAIIEADRFRQRRRRAV